MTHHTDAEQERAEFDLYWLDRQRKRGFGQQLTDKEMLAYPERRADEFHAWQAARRAPAGQVPQGWIDPNDKAQKQYLPHIGERVLFKHDGCVYLGKHTGGSFKAEYPLGKTFGTWDCKWMYPSVLDAAVPQPPEATVNDSLTVEAAPVQMPEPVAYLYHDAPTLEDYIANERAGIPINSACIGVKRIPHCRNETPLYTEHQVRQLLAQHGIQEQST